MTIIFIVGILSGKFVPIAGQEYSIESAGNHVNVFEADAWIDSNEVKNGYFKYFYKTWIPKHKTRGNVRPD